MSDGSWLALGLVAALAVGAARPKGSFATVAELRRALSEAPRGSLNKRGLSQILSTSKRLREAPKYARLFLTMEPQDVPDDLLIATLLAGATKVDPVKAASDLLREVQGEVGRVVQALPQGLEDDLTAVGRARLIAASELSRRAEYRGAAREVVQILGPDAIVRLLKSMSRGPDEILSAIYLDARRNVIGSRVLSRGSSRFTIVDPISVFRPAVQLGASAVILAHQHPSGDPKPSQQDYDVTRRVVAAGRTLGIPLLDHIVLSGDTARYTSFAELGEVPVTGSPPMVTRG